MKNSRCYVLLAVFVQLLISSSLFADFSGGSGTQADPYQISTAQDLLYMDDPNIQQSVSDPNIFFQLVSDIDLSDYTFDDSPIASEGEFYDCFNGDGHTISNLTISASDKDYIGLFGKIGRGGYVSNLALINVNISGDVYIGGICGQNIGSITSCYSEGTVSGKSLTGGLCGRNYGRINSSYSNSSVTANLYNVGGLCGINSGDIINCYSTGSVSGKSSVGGLCGYHFANYTIIKDSFWNIESSGLTVGYKTSISDPGAIDNVQGLTTAQMLTQSYYLDAGWDFSDTDGDPAVWKMLPGYYPTHIWDTTEHNIMPNFIGLTEQQAIAELQIIGIEFDVQYLDSLIQNDTVLSQSITAGTFYTLEDTIVLSIYKSPFNGSGTKTEPWEIATAEELLCIDELLDPNLYTSTNYFELVSDIDLSNYPLSKSAISLDKGFIDCFDGGGYKISNLTISTDNKQQIGFFNKIETGGYVSNLKIINVNISGENLATGALCGENYGTITNCYSTGYVSSDKNTGGLSGLNYGEITNCHSICSVDGEYLAGGLCGYNDYGIINNCYSAGSVNGDSNVGGLCGSNYQGTINNCYSAGSVNGGSDVGGLCGHQVGDNAIIKNSFWNIESSGLSVGYNLHSYRPGTIDNVQGLTTTQMLTQSYYLDADWDFSDTDGDPAIWMMPYSSYPVHAWETAVRIVMPDLIGLTEQQAIAELQNIGIEFEVQYLDSLAPLDTVISQSINAGIFYISGDILVLRVSAGCLLNGKGTELEPWEITNAEELLYMDNILDPNLNVSDTTMFFKLASDIDFSGYTFANSPIASETEFHHHFYGDGYTISNLTISASNKDYLGLFGTIGEGGYVSNLALINIYVFGHNNIGGLCGENYGTITSCYYSGTIKGDYNVGGFCGRNYDTITNCYAIGSVHGDTHIGGFCGYNFYGTITNCYATGAVIGDDYVGGLCGIQYGNNAIIEDSFWNIESSGITVGYKQSQSKPGTIDNVQGLTTAQMISQSYYLDAGWDFSDTDGDPAIWQMASGNYPVHAWDTTEHIVVPSLIGMTEQQAIAELQNAEINFEVEYLDSLAPLDTVFSQSTYFYISGDTLVLRVSVGLPLNGNGTEIEPWEIATSEELLYIADTLDPDRSVSDPNIFFKLISDIDLSDYTFDDSPIASEGEFYDCFDGNGHTISNLTISASNKNYIGLFGEIGEGGYVSNLALENVSISGNDNIGGLCGENGGSISSCFSNGSVSGDNYIGGLSGYNNGTITNSYTTGAVTGNQSVGGLCGYNFSGTITNCYTIGTASGNNNIGGLCGYQYADNAIIEDSFWNIDTSGLTVGYNLSWTYPGTIDNVQGLTTAQMMTQSYYLDAGWDFSDTYGDPAIWYMVSPGEDYPKLVWQRSTPGDIAGAWGVDIADLEILATEWLSPGNLADFDNNNIVDMMDFAVLAQNWLRKPGDNLPSPLIAHWPLNETSGAIAEDVSENTNPGTVYGSPAYGSGVRSGCYVFDGIDDYIVSDACQGVTGNKARTVSAYIKVPAGALNDVQTIVSWGSSIPGSNAKWFVGLDDLNGQLTLGTYANRVIGGPNLADDQWHHVTVVMPSGATNINQVKFFIDGIEVATNAASLDATIYTAASEVSIGANNSSRPDEEYATSNMFLGAIDDVKIYSTDLRPTENSELYDINYFDQNNFIGHWSLDEAIGVNTLDSSVYNNKALINGNPTIATGIDGNCYILDGVDDYVSLPAIIVPGSEPFSACLWTKGGGPAQSLICQADGSGLGRIWVGIDGFNNMRTVLQKSGGSPLASPTAWDTTSWHHVAIVWDGARRYVYVDGTIVAEDTTDLGESLEFADGPIYIGAHKYLGSTNFWNGAIEDVRIYKKALNSTEINELVNIGN